MKENLTAADLFNDQIIPFFAERQIDVLRALADRGTEYCGKVENHAYQLYLATEDVDHTKTKANSPRSISWPMGSVSVAHCTIKDEFYDIVFRKKAFQNLGGTSN